MSEITVEPVHFKECRNIVDSAGVQVVQLRNALKTYLWLEIVKKKNYSITMYLHIHIMYAHLFYQVPSMDGARKRKQTVGGQFKVCFTQIIDFLVLDIKKFPGNTSLKSN